ncbi:Zinc finger ccch domain-containing protein [Thalictrum thalictroides]|uniref:Zinc finger ccch domain-containing protein n=1 Tax=Thalictrum thalictroides TaxID=46969 RepID=A0A7J6X1U9_THATH|nr:Zinc finger ccch domain-containing protein [Thalictrum thalictroides]
MDYGGGEARTFTSGNVVEIIPQSQEIGNLDNWMPGLNDQAIWATEDDYNVWNADASVDTPSNSNYDGRQSLTPSGSEPPNKKSRSSQGGDSQLSGFGRDMASGNRSRAIGKMFFKTKLCCKFRNGTCPYISNCNFAHGIEELRKPPPNWQEIVAAQDDDRGVSSEPREEHQIPCLISTGLGTESQRSYKGRHCKKFYTEEGCPYGDNCTFLHDEQSKARESVAISLGPTMGNNAYGNNANGSNQKPSNWKTRICNKWEMTGYCPFGSKCHFAHGLGELHRYGGGLVDVEGRDAASAPSDMKQVGVSLKTPMETVVSSSTLVPHTDVYHMGVPSQRSSGVNLRPGVRPIQKWKGPDKISRIYGDWIDDNEWDTPR